ncbi:hypothetical protein B0T22DRAFT_219039 [Podospora appendiculata]|uniref:GPI anchored protein n=1 Tax=Podospora appendiculata TaxID=314037 RepID=A0AAE0X5Z9_9PEZI|nr:hypothetical protein B0T22DRAFT_219039 [Podospora appendiculata]
MHLLPLSLWLVVTSHLEAHALAQAQHPTAIKKMPPDQGEKFYPEYCAFPDHGTFAPPAQAPFAPAAAAAAAAKAIAPRHLAANASAQIPYLPPFAPLLDDDDDEHQEQRIIPAAPGRSIFGRAAEALARLERRQWACPAGTSNCAGIGFPNSCCQTGERCVQITDTGLGKVGCCPAGATCGGTITSCTDGNTPCASEIGGGCCIPGFVCQGVGCVQSVSTTMTGVAPTPTGVTTLTSTSTTVISGAAPSTVVVTVVITITPSQASPVTSTTTQIVSLSPSSTPPQATDTATATTTDGIVPPVRPTSSNSDDTSTYCPTGFYPCLASAGGGCCQTGRDCQTTSCPAVSSTTFVNTHGVTVAVPASGVPATTTTGTCAGGWFLCGTEAGPLPGCCPTGYRCGTASCAAAAAGGTATVAKELPGSSSGGSGNMARGFEAVGFVGLVAWLMMM